MVLRVGVLGLSHDHIWPNLKALAAGNVGQLAVVAEPDPALRARLADEHGAIETETSFDDLLERGDIDAVMVYADNRLSVELAQKAVARGLPTMIEKPMAADLAGADALVNAAEAAGVAADGELADGVAAGDHPGARAAPRVAWSVSRSR